jgi:hypothetical protein
LQAETLRRQHQQASDLAHYFDLWSTYHEDDIEALYSSLPDGLFRNYWAFANWVFAICPRDGQGRPAMPSDIQIHQWCDEREEYMNVMKLLKDLQLSMTYEEFLALTPANQTILRCQHSKLARTT